MSLREKIGVSGPILEVHLPSVLIPPAFPLMRDGPLGLVRYGRRDISDMSLITSPVVKKLRSKVGGAIRK
ncbi:MAG: hypothetical protein NZ957_05855 [Thaumarchaeota archaeon]|nr:hypothetical protein [Candidatus Calditenuaceae archaeon]